jgi:Flp pilus assembly protein TadG
MRIRLHSPHNRDRALIESAASIPLIPSRLNPQNVAVLRRISRMCHFDEGQALVETALVLPIILLSVMGILTFGIFTMQIMSLNEGISSAGRVLAVSAGQTTDPCSLAATAIQNASPLLNPSNLSYTFTLTPSGSSAASYTGASCSSTSTTTGMAGSLVSGGTAQVSATYSNCSLKFYGKNFLPNGCSITATIIEVVQ